MTAGWPRRGLERLGRKRQEAEFRKICAHGLLDFITQTSKAMPESPCPPEIRRGGFGFAVIGGDPGVRLSGWRQKERWWAEFLARGGAAKSNSSGAFAS